MDKVQQKNGPPVKSTARKINESMHWEEANMPKKKISVG